MVEENRNIPLRQCEREPSPMHGLDAEFTLVAALRNRFDILDISIARFAKSETGRPGRDDVFRIYPAILAL